MSLLVTKQHATRWSQCAFVMVNSLMLMAEHRGTFHKVVWKDFFPLKIIFIFK